MLLSLNTLRGAVRAYRGTSLIRNSTPLGPYSRTMPGALWWSLEGGLFLVSEVPCRASCLMPSRVLARARPTLNTIHTPPLL